MWTVVCTWQYRPWAGWIKPSLQHFQFCCFGFSLRILIFPDEAPKHFLRRLFAFLSILNFCYVVDIWMVGLSFNFFWNCDLKLLYLFYIWCFPVFFILVYSYDLLLIALFSVLFIHGFFLWSLLKSFIGMCSSIWDNRGILKNDQRVFVEALWSVVIFCIEITERSFDKVIKIFLLVGENHLLWKWLWSIWM
jgi:hypothetical protein